MRLDWSVQKCQLVELGPAGTSSCPLPVHSRPSSGQNHSLIIFQHGPFLSALVQSPVRRCEPLQLLPHDGLGGQPNLNQGLPGRDITAECLLSSAPFPNAITLFWTKFRPASRTRPDARPPGDENGLTSVGTPNTAHRRRTDLVPTLTMRREDNPSGSATPRRSPGRAVSMSRLEQLARPQRQLLRPQHVGGAVQGARSMQHLAPPSPGQTGGRELTNGGGRARARTSGATPKEKKGERANVRRTRSSKV